MKYLFLSYTNKGNPLEMLIDPFSGSDTEGAALWHLAEASGLDPDPLTSKTTLRAMLEKIDIKLLHAEIK